MKTIYSSPVSKAVWLFVQTLGSTVTAVVGAEVAKRAVQKFGGQADHEKWREQAEHSEVRVHELEKEVQDLQDRLSSIKTQAFSVPWPPIPPQHNPESNSPIIDPTRPHFPKNE